MLKLDYREVDRRATLAWHEGDTNQPWVDILRRLILDHTEDADQENAYRLSIPWWNFVALRPQLMELFTSFGLNPASGLIVSDAARDLLARSRNAANAYNAASTAGETDIAVIEAGLATAGFARQLSDEQMRNVRKIAALPNAATFSVPGAGKTTEALAFFAMRATASEGLLVVAPKNAFAAWDEQAALCFPAAAPVFVRLTGGRERIAKALAANPRFSLITYQQLARVYDLIAAHCAQYATFVFLDESHRIKSGVGKQTARAALTLTHLPAGKLVMSGTPMPQSIDDLVPQFTFLYPEVPVDSTSVIDLMRPIYVRTNKAELRLPDVTRNFVQLPLAPVQAELYNLMRSEIAREAATALNMQSKQSFRSLGRSVARLLQFVSNPALLSASLGFAHPDLLSAVLAEGEGPKLRYILKRARTLARAGHKVLIWTSFVRNVEYIADRLADLGAVYIHGGVEAGDEDDDDTREGKIRLFHDDPNVQVLVANPAAASEGISLHRVCHHALYLDRTFNAAHYLQSEDRIHRFGLAPDEQTFIEIVEGKDTVDQVVRTRLGFKITQMAVALEDSSLSPDPIALDPVDIEDYEDYTTGLTSDDIKALLTDLSVSA